MGCAGADITGDAGRLLLSWTDATTALWTASTGALRVEGRASGTGRTAGTGTDRDRSAAAFMCPAPASFTRRVRQTTSSSAAGCPATRVSQEFHAALSAMR